MTQREQLPGIALAADAAGQLLKSAEDRFSVDILFAIESGSRAWGFPSPDSDYDIRFVYRHPLSWYLTLQEGRDTIESFEGGDLDAGGWEVRKFLRHIQRSNAVCWEWLQSPIVYSESEQRAAFLEVARPFFSCRASWHHYCSQLKRLAESLAESPDSRLKDQLYALRVALAARWIHEQHSPPPMTLAGLLQQEVARELVNLADTLVEEKRDAQERARTATSDLLSRFVAETLALDSQCRDTLPVGRGRQEDLDLFLLRLVNRSL